MNDELKNLKRFLEVNHLSQSKFSKFSGIPQSTISYFINGKHTSNKKTVDRIRKAMVQWYQFNNITSICNFIEENKYVINTLEEEHLPWYKRLFKFLLKYK